MKCFSAMILFLLSALGAVCLFAYAGEGSSGKSPPVVQVAQADNPEACEIGTPAEAKGQTDQSDKGRQNWLNITKPARNPISESRVNLHNKEDPARALTIADSATRNVRYRQRE